ncbi:MAG: DUF1588 domain-containing protein [Planctomycetaceae bacterium]|nr:DUF1588 domain-containing protein [Planctomycetaceae bacterium]MCB9952581.1 DUF1588 domain-containing protein [Planctomycetaceae bacterium]
MRALTVSLLLWLAVPTFADDSYASLKQLLSDKCEYCHNSDDANGGISFDSPLLESVFLAKPQLNLKVLKAIDSGAMPPESEDALPDPLRDEAVISLTSILRSSAQNAELATSPLHRLNRFQYNNTVRDLFQLNRDVFPLSEKLMTRTDNYLARRIDSDAIQMPDEIHATSHALQPVPGLADVKPFPKDLRAEHGFNNQANQLTLSPLLLDSFLRLSVSIVESPDFNVENVGVWNEFFAAPNVEANREEVVRSRLAKFLRRTFRRTVEPDVIDRYAAYAAKNLNEGQSFPEAMKKVAAAALSSPMFLYRSVSEEPDERPFDVASQLSYFLWGSCPDEELLQLAESGELLKPEVFRRTVDRMLVDPKVERFLDSYPAQWMQLENLMAATPDPAINPYFHLDPEVPASLQMVVEPLLLFDTVFVENRPLVELIEPQFNYRSEFLRTWYETDLKPQPVDVGGIQRANAERDAQRQKLGTQLDQLRKELAALVDPVRAELLKSKQGTDQSGSAQSLDPFAVWDFERSLKESVRGLDLQSHGEISFADGMVDLNKSYLISGPLPVDLKAKTLEVRFRLENLDQRGGGLMGIQGQGDFFDTIVIGERKNRHWISGSNGFSRTDDFAESSEENVTDQLIHLVMVYAEDGTTTLYRNGEPYGKPFNKGSATFPKENSSVIFGLRHLPPGGNKFLSVSIDQARLYNRALTPEEVVMAASDAGTFISTAEILAAMTQEQRDRHESLVQAVKEADSALGRIPPNVDVARAIEVEKRRFEIELRKQLHESVFRRTPAENTRYGGIITNAAVLSMTSGPNRTHPVARGVWIVEVIFNNPPPPPPNNVPPLDEENSDKELTIREKFAAHRENPSCAGCHTKLDPLGFALENYDITGRWRDRYENGRKVDTAGTLLRRHDFNDVIAFKRALVDEQRRFAKSFTEHLLRFAIERELEPHDTLLVDEVLANCEADGYRLQSLMREVARVAFAASNEK